MALLDRVELPAVAPKREYCVVGVVTLLSGCGHKPAALIGCGRIDCSVCEANRARAERAAWGPVVRGMEKAKMLVLARKSEGDLERANANLKKAFEKFMDKRLGVRARETLLRQVGRFVWEHRAEFNRNHADGSGRRSAREWLTSCKKFLREGLPKFERKDRKRRLRDAYRKEREAKELRDLGALQRAIVGKRTSNVYTVKVRDLFFGFRSWEVTRNNERGLWHPHYHVTFDTRRKLFIPWPVLVVLWMQANGGEEHITFGDPDDATDCDKDSLGRTAHVSRLRNVDEAIKYVCKPNVIKTGGPAVVDELMKVVDRKKRIWPLGGAKPVTPEKLPCRFCGKPDCKWHKAAGKFDGKVSDDPDGRSQVWRNAVGELLRIFFVPSDPETGRRAGWEWVLLPPLLDSTGGLPDGVGANCLTRGGGNLVRAGPAPPSVRQGVMDGLELV